MCPYHIFLTPKIWHSCIHFTQCLKSLICDVFSYTHLLQIIELPTDPPRIRMEVQFICETPFKVLRKSWESPEEVLRKSWESPDSPEKGVRKSWEGPENVLIKSEKVLRKSEKVLSKVLRKEWKSPKEVRGRTEKVLLSESDQKVSKKSSEFKILYFSCRTSWQSCLIWSVC